MRAKLLITIIFGVLLWGCANSRESYIKRMIGSELIINVDSMFIGDNSRSYINDLDKQLKIVVYSDSSNCNACDIQFPLWRIRYRELSRENDTGLIFIINTKDISDMELNANVVKAPGLRLYDSQGVFKKNNRLFDHREFHVFLLDQDNKIILIGNPLTNHNLYALYKRAIEMQTNNGGN